MTEHMGDADQSSDVADGTGPLPAEADETVEATAPLGTDTEWDVAPLGTDTGQDVAPLVIEAGELGLRTTLGWVYRDVDMQVAAGSVVAVTGPSGSGRSSLLLTLTGRMKPTAGTLRVGGLDLPARAKQVRRRTAVTRISSHIGLDGSQLVREAISERRMLVHHPAAGLDQFDAAIELVGFTGSGRQQVGELPAVEVALLDLALAAVPRADVIAVDDVEYRLTPAEQQRVWAAIARLAAHGPVVVVSTTMPEIDVADHQIVLTREG